MLFLVCFRGVHPDFREAEFRAAVEVVRRGRDAAYRLDAADAAAAAAAAEGDPPPGGGRVHPLTAAAAAAASRDAPPPRGPQRRRRTRRRVRAYPPLELAPTIHTLPLWAAADGARRGRRADALAPQGEVFYYVHLADEAEAAAAAARCVLVRGILRPIAHGAVIQECVAGAVGAADADDPAYGGLLRPLVGGDDGGGGDGGDGNGGAARPPPTFKCVCECFGRTLTPEDQLARFEHLRPVLTRFGGRVRMKAPDVEVWVVEDGTPLGARRPPPGTATPAAAGGGTTAPSPPPPPPALSQVLLARLVGRGCARVADDYSLKRRAYIGPTAMDAALSFIMANLALVRPTSVALDPFAGTGSCLVAAACRGAAVLASDLSRRALAGKLPAVDLASNFVQYGLPAPLDAVRMDVLCPAWRWPAGGLVTAVVCDPPYGIREGSRALAPLPAAASAAAAAAGRPHAPPTVRVAFDDFLHHLLHAAAAALVPGGRLVYWLPTVPAEYAPADVPVHPLLRLVANCEQPLSGKLARRLITMERVGDGPPPAAGGAPAAAAAAAPVDPRAVPLPTRTHVPAHANLAAKVFGVADRLEDALPRRPVEADAVRVKAVTGTGVGRGDAQSPEAAVAAATQARACRVAEPVAAAAARP